MHESVRRFAGLGAGVLFAFAVGCGTGPSSVEQGKPTSSTSGGTSTTSSSTSGAGGSGGSTTTTKDGGAGGTTSSAGGGGTGGHGGQAHGGSGGTGGAAPDGGTGGAATDGGTGGAAGGLADGGQGGSGGSGGCSSDAQCDDKNFCNGAETCVSGVCTPGQSPNCDDGLSCTNDACDPVAGACTHTASNAACDDGVYCNGAETCDPVNGQAPSGCVAGAPPSCNDNIPCTLDFCDEGAKACTHTPSNAVCDDGVFCNGAETCDLVNGCVPGLPPSCDDGILCTADFCDGGNDACHNVPQDAKCSDGLVCDGVETCNPALGDKLTGCLAGAPLVCNDGIACTLDSCDEAAKGCVYLPNSLACDDGVYCNGMEVCDAGLGCQPGAPVVCDDKLSCTSDACDEQQKKCVYTPNNAACDDGLYCNGVETCDPNGVAPTGCKAGTPVVCASDNIACTVDACDNALQTCTYTANNALCAPGQFCVPQVGGCEAAKPCQTDAQCDDGNACNGKETCNVVCQPGTPINCSDGIQCTVDTCDPATGACTNTPNDAFCNDGFACNGIETCSAQQGCVTTGPMDCSDGVACTVDVCQEPGVCLHSPVDAFCDDGKLCNGAEVCTPQGCQAGTPYVCPDDGIACTTGVCDPVLNACVQLADDSKCPCGQTCNPAKGGCGNFCVVATCQGHVYQCGDCVDNDADCKIDSADPDCLGPCDNTEDSYYGGIPGQNNAPCKSDCYFDQDTGSGNDDCYWSHSCDPLEVAPNYPPEGQQCAYNPNTNVSGSGQTCSQLYAAQSSQCLSYCGQLTPNGCDCFGCCVIPGAPTPVWLGSENPKGVGSCTVDTVADPTKCKPCTQVPACLNPCEHCEICVGKPELPPDCVAQICPAGRQLCGGPGQQPCPSGQSCITGCCENNPQ
jgi:hypothetical protein